MITADELRVSAAFAQLPGSELASMADRAADLHVAAGEWLIQEGEVASFFVLIAGRLAVMKAGRQISRLGDGR